MHKKRLIAIIMALSLSVCMAPTGTVNAAQNKTDNDITVESEESVENAIERVEIWTAQDFIDFASQCYIDSWSRNKYVILMNDIDLSGADFIPVPVFNGTFDGDGHTISGFNYVGSGYVVGLFRYIESNGLVKSLTLKGNISSENEEECIGSIAGINRGTIRNCSFIGTVSGRDTVGGIVGINETTGTISGCVSKGRVTAYYSTGGIAGINHGAINYCTNNSGINDNAEWVETDDEMGGVEMVKSLVSDDESTNEIYSGVDTGGIAGYSDGYITRCTNKGTVGYEHTGYNVGGIAGRQAGVISLSINNGTVYGRKDIGGIAGQMEPDIEVNEAESLRDALDKLHDLVNKTIDDMTDTKNTVKSDLDNMIKYADAAVDSGDVLATKLTDFTDDNIDDVNTLTERLENVLDMLPDVLDNITTAGDNANNLSDNLNNLVDDLDFTDEISDDDKDKIKSDRDDISTQTGKLQEQSKAIEIYTDAIESILEKYDNTSTGNSSINNIVNGTTSNISDADMTAIGENLNGILGILGEMSSTTGDIINDISEVTKILGDALSSTADLVGLDADKANEAARYTVDALKTATNNTKSIVNYLNSQEELRFSQLGDDFDTTKESLHNDLTGLSNSIKSLNNNASNYTDIVNNDLKAVNNQLNVVFNLLADRIVEVDEIGLDDFYEDVSDVDIDAITTGRVEYCENNGIVQGDINIGGIAGAMAIDDEDPEDSAAGNTEYKLGRSYTAKSLIIGSVNNGYITAKKDGAGGVCGYMDHGIIVDSEAYGKVESTEGGYVGGICGQSMTVIRDCYALCSVSGGQNVGGIAGYADTLSGCYAMATVTAENGRVGAIAGQIASYEDVAVNDDYEYNVSNNYFVNDELNGIDNISYVGMAEPITYSALLEVANIPTEFWHLQVIYWIEDTYLGSEEVNYGDKLDNLTYPEIPQKEGYYGEWPDVSDMIVNGTMVIEAEYKDNVTVVKSTGVETDEDGSQKALAYVEDRFTENTVLYVEKVEMEAPEEAAEKEYVVYNISIEDDMLSDTDAFALRLLNPYGDKAVVYVYTDGSWQQVESKVRGGYLHVTMTGSQQYFCIVNNKPSTLFVVIVASIGVAVILILAIVIISVVLMVRKGKDRRNKRKQAKQQHKSAE